MITGYVKSGKGDVALQLFNQIRETDVVADRYVLSSVLSACSVLDFVEGGKQVHCHVLRRGAEMDVSVINVLIDFYSKCGKVKAARRLFDEMVVRNVISWTTMIAGYMQNSFDREAMKLFSEMSRLGWKPDGFACTSVLTSCGSLEALDQGRQFHTQLIKHAMDSDPFVTNAIIDMYAKCGSFEDACKTFNSAIWRDVVCWNSMISTYAHHGEAEGALETFERMLKEGIKPNYVTFVGLLSACVHAGFVELGLHHFESMSTFGVEAGIEHYACVVSLLGHAGKLYEAKALIETMPIKTAAVLWRSLLSACRIAGNVELGKYAAERAISIDPMDSGSYTLLSNIFASKGMWADVKRVRARMDLEGVLKEPGCSWIEVNNETNVFIARDRTHHEANLIYLVLDNLIMHIKGAGYVPDIANTPDK
ncbi:hypothetical protein POUND7_013623 [Theobroma cacao]